MVILSVSSKNKNYDTKESVKVEGVRRYARVSVRRVTSKFKYTRD